MELINYAVTESHVNKTKTCIANIIYVCHFVNYGTHFSLQRIN